MAASIEGETQQPLYRVDSLTVPQPSSQPSSQTSHVNYDELDKSLSHRAFMPPTSSPAPESADPEHNFLPGQIRHDDSARTGDAGLSSLGFGESTAMLGEEAVAAGDMLRTNSNGARAAPPPLRKTNSGTVYTTWATQRQAGSSRAASPVGSGPSRPPSRALNRLLQEEVDELDSSSPAPLHDGDVEGENESTPNVPTPPTATPHSRRLATVNPSTPPKDPNHGTYKPVSAHKVPSLAAPPTAGPSSHASRPVRSSRSPSRVLPVSGGPSRPAPRRPVARLARPAASETQESFGMDNSGIKGRQKLDQLERQQLRGMTRSVSASSARQYSTSVAVQEPEEGEEDAPVAGEDHEHLSNKVKSAASEGDGGKAERLTGVTQNNSTTSRQQTQEPTTQEAYLSGNAPAHTEEQDDLTSHHMSYSQRSGDGDSQPVRSARVRKQVLDSSDNEQDNEHDQSVLFTQFTDQQEGATSSNAAVRTLSQVRASPSNKSISGMSVSEAGGVPPEAQGYYDTYRSQDFGDGDQSGLSQPNEAPVLPSWPDRLEQHSSRSLEQPSIPPMPRLGQNTRRFGQFEETMSSVPPIHQQGRRSLAKLGSIGSQGSMEGPQPSYDANPSRNELFSSPSAGPGDYTQESSRSNLDQSLQATQYVATESWRGGRKQMQSQTQDEVDEDEGEQPGADHSGGVESGKSREKDSQSQNYDPNISSGDIANGSTHKSQSLQSDGTSHGTSNGTHPSSIAEQTQTQIATEDSQRRARKAAEARQMEREASLEARKTAQMTAATADRGRSSVKTASPIKEKSANQAAFDKMPQIEAHRMLSRTGSTTMASAPILALSNAIKVDPPKHTGLSETLSESNIGQVNRASLSPPLHNAYQANGVGNSDDATHESSRSGAGSGSALFTLPNDADNARLEGRHRRTRSRSSNIAEPTSSMQADDLIPRITQTQRSDAASVSPQEDDASQLSELSQPVRKGGSRRAERLAPINEASSPGRPIVTRNLSSPLRSDPPSPPPANEADNDVDMDARNNDGADAGSNDGELEETLNSHRSAPAPQARTGLQVPQTLEPTLLNGGETVQTLVIQPRMATPTKKYGGQHANNALAAPPAANVKPSRRLTRQPKTGPRSPDPLAEQTESLAQLDAAAARSLREPADEARAEELSNGQEEEDDDDEQLVVSARGQGAQRGGKRTRRIASSSPAGDGDVDMGNDRDVGEEGSGGEDAEGEDHSTSEQDSADGEADGIEEEDEDESPESPPTPEDRTDESFRPPTPEDRTDESFRPPAKSLAKASRKPAPLPLSKKRKRNVMPTPSLTQSPSPSPIATKRARNAPRRFTPNGDSPTKSTRTAGTSLAQTADPPAGGDAEDDDDEPESPPTPVDTTDYSFVPAAVARKPAAKRPSDVVVILPASSSKRAKTNGTVKTGPQATDAKKGKGQVTKEQTPLPPATRSQSVNARATQEPTPSLAAGSEGAEDDEDDENVDVNGPGVFGKFGQSYYAGRIIQREGPLCVIEFADTETETMPIGDFRLATLRKGDKIRSNLKDKYAKAIFIVKEDWSYPAVFTEEERDMLIDVIVEKTGVEHAIPLRNIYINARTIQTSWQDRQLDETVIEHIPFADGLAKRGGATSAAKPLGKTATKLVQGTNAFAGQVFLITPSGEATKKYKDLITRNGGAVCEWEDLFVDSSSARAGGSSNLKLVFGAGLSTDQTPYLITTSSIGGEFEATRKGETQQGTMKAKIMCALAFGIPCLAPAYIEEALRDPDHDIRGFLLVPGTSLKHGAPTSQVVDAAWGSEGWDVTEARHELRPLKGKQVLFAGPRPNDLLNIVTACLTGLGAESLKVNDTYTGETLRDYDVVLVANKAKKTAALPDEIANAPNGCDVQWLKRICISGEWLPPTFYTWKQA